MTPTERVREAISKIDGVMWATHGEPEGSPGGNARVAWIKFGLERSHRGWRAADFIAWACMDDLKHAGYQLLLFPVMPPPWLNEPFDDFRFVLEMLEVPDSNPKNIGAIASLIDKWRDEHFRRAP
jgi:hypothetical protein